LSVSPIKVAEKNIDIFVKDEGDNKNQLLDIKFSMNENAINAMWYPDD